MKVEKRKVQVYRFHLVILELCQLHSEGRKKVQLMLDCQNTEQQQKDRQVAWRNCGD